MEILSNNNQLKLNTKVNISTVELVSEKMRRLGQMFEATLYPIKTEAEHGYKKPEFLSAQNTTA